MIPNSLLVEFLRYDSLDARTGNGTPHYLAVTIPSAGKRAMVSLGPAKRIDALIDQYCNTSMRSGKNLLV